MMPTKEVEKSREENKGRLHVPTGDIPDEDVRNKGQYKELDPPKTDITQKPWEPKFKDEPLYAGGNFTREGKTNVYLPDFNDRSRMLFKTKYFGEVRT